MDKEHACAHAHGQDRLHSVWVEHGCGLHCHTAIRGSSAARACVESLGVSFSVEKASEREERGDRVSGASEWWCRTAPGVEKYFYHASASCCARAATARSLRSDPRPRGGGRGHCSSALTAC